MTDAPAATMDLGSLVATVTGARLHGPSATPIGSLAHDTRRVRPGALFIALRGERVDGHAYLAAALAAGASAVVVDGAYAAAYGVPSGAAATLVVPDTRRALSALANAYYGEPTRALRVTGVTGTNGKTTTTQLIAAVLEAAGIATGSIGTLGARLGGAMWSLENTTPLALELQALFAEMRARGARAVAMEVSSHALALDRVADVTFALAVLTNVTRDHLDFHGTFAAYAATKRELFARAPHAILNVDDACGARWAAELAALGRAPVTYGFGDATVRAREVVMRAGGSAFVVDGARFAVRLPGRFNVANALAALAVAREYGVADALAARALAAFEGVPGRMEHLAGGGIDVLVDYAHTPDALDVVLRAARETARGDLTVVFGCGGDRDRGKRPEMGRIASAGADRVIVTSDNPRGESPQAIVDEILAGVGPAANVVALLDRHAAIAHAIASARPGDVVVVAGKGHETYQTTGTAINHFDDRDEVRAALAVRETAAP